MFTFVFGRFFDLSEKREITAIRLDLTGRVQGVGFRPFVFRQAVALGINGWVQNTNEGVTVWIEGEQPSLDRFMEALDTRSPLASFISNLSVNYINPEHYSSFDIRPSLNLSEEITEISPDIAVCHDCLEDMKHQAHRIGYPLTNCTNCGPRFSIVMDLPYDRPRTTMHDFPMCGACSAEYENVMDRRFHAQPVACNVCGPVYQLWENGLLVEHSLPAIMQRVIREIRSGEVVAIKGVGGFHLLCDPGNDEAVLRLRERKGRERKPLAVMFRDLATASSFADLSPVEEQALISWQRPIVLLAQRPDPPVPLSRSLNEGLAALGVVLPYMPFHYMLFEKLDLPGIVLTSGNLSEHPILIENDQAVLQFREVAALVVTHQREIYNRVDDSVVREMRDAPRVFRRARGYCPDPIPLTLPSGGILAMGAELVNSFCLGKGNRAYLSQYIGDLKNPATQQYYRQTIDRFQQLFRVVPELIVTDLHPEYHSTKLGKELQRNLKKTDNIIPLMQVQHHHAHIASCMAEHQLDEKVIGVAFDGTGLGTDRHSWGSEVMIADLEGFERIAHFEYLPMPGGDKAVEEPWRMGIAALYHTFGEGLKQLALPFITEMQPDSLEWILQMIRRSVNTPFTCGAGRYFDVVASLLGCCHKSGYEGEGPMKLEALTREGFREEYPLETGAVISFIPAFKALVRDLKTGKNPELISTRFHNTVITAIIHGVLAAREQSALDKVVLSGGVFQNRYLVDHLVPRLQDKKFNVYLHASVPPNDGGVALGQLMIAAKKRDNDVFRRTGKSD